MHLPRSTLAHASLVAVLTAALYSLGLSASPPHLTHDEIKFALQAKSIADSGRDINGRYFPVYFKEPGFAVGRDPLCIYVTAGVLKVLPLSESSIRFASVLVGSASVALTFVLATLHFGRRRAGWIAAALLALSPTFYIHSRLALSVIYPVVFTLLWLIAVRLYLLRQEVRYIGAAGLILGLGVYSYLAAAIMMPLYLVATIAMLVARHDARGVRLIVLSFAVMMLPIVLWQVVEPERYANILTAYRFYEAEQSSPEQKVIELVSPSSIRARVDTFWATFSPETLFFTGESSLQISTREVGSLLTPVAAFLVTGLVALLGRQRSPFGWLLVAGLVTGPLPAVIMLDGEIRRWLVVLPFIAMISSVGVEQWLNGSRWIRRAGFVFLLLMPIQFAAFAHDYFGSYRERASTWFGGNIRAGLEAVIEHARQHPPSTVLISTEIPWVDAYWRFYTAVHGEDWLLERTTYLERDGDEMPPPAPGAVIVLAATNRDMVLRMPEEGWALRRTIDDLDGKPSIAIGTPVTPP